ncbi:MAG: tetratricopeptide repeat protein [Victivallales bacterium]|nr:tetratricopeptide repeat protein [Victivallales bacterium]
MSRDKIRLALLLCLYVSAGTLLRIYYLHEFSASPLFDVPKGADVEEYWVWAGDIIAGRWLWANVHIHAPLYPFFLAMLYCLFANLSSCFFWIRFSQIMLGFFSFLPLLGVMRLFVGTGEDDCPGHGAGRPKLSTESLCFLALWCWYPPLVFYLGELTSEVLMIPLLSTALYLLYRSEQGLPLPKFVTGKTEEVDLIVEGSGGTSPTPRQRFSLQLPGMGNLFHCLAGLCSGLACISHPFALFFMFSEIIYLYIRGNLKGMAFFAISALAAIFPVSFYNMVILGEAIPIQANGGFNLYLGNNPDADGTCNMRPGPDWDDFHLGAEYKARELGLSKDSLLIQETAVFIMKNPLAWIGLVGRKALMVWNYRELSAGADLYPIRYFTSFQRTFRWAFGACAVMALTAILLNIGNRIFIYRYRHLLILIGTFWAGQALLVTSGRYRVAMIPCILILASWTLVNLGRTLFTRPRRTARFTVGIIASAAVVYAPVAPFHHEREKAEAASILGEACLIKGDLENAETHLRFAEKNMPPWSRNHNLLGILMENKGQPEEALEYYLKAVKTNPSEPDSFMNIALLFSRKNDSAKAADFFEKAFSLRTSHSAELYYNYAIFCSARGDTRKAFDNYLKCLDVNPGHVMALNNLGIIFFSEEQFSDAAILFEKSLRMDPGNLKRMLNLALAQYASGDHRASRKTLNRILRVNPSMDEALRLQKILDSRANFNTPRGHGEF